MRAGSWCAMLPLGAILWAACSEGDPILEARAKDVMAAAYVRFEVLDGLAKRALEVEPEEGGFRAVDAPETRDPGLPPLKPATGGVWRRPGNHHLLAEFPPGAAGTMRLSSGPVSVEIRPTGARDAAGVAVGRALVYQDAYPGAHTIHLVQKLRTEEFVLLHDRRAPRSFEYRVNVIKGGGRVRQMGELVEVLDAKGNAWLRLERPYLVDAEGKRRPVQARLEGTRLTLTMPADVDRYPVLLDPGWTTTGSMTTGRKSHTATLLKNGQVLVTGGKGDRYSYYSSTELFNPKTGTWTGSGPMTTRRMNHIATLLQSGKVLVTGGSSAELYDPNTGKWTATSAMVRGHSGHTATLLKSGKVLVAGCGWGSGHGSAAEIYDPAMGTWTATGSMHYPTCSHAALLMPSGIVLTAGGSYQSKFDWCGEEFNPKTGIWRWICYSKSVRCIYHSFTLLKTGAALTVGGYDGTKHLTSAAIFAFQGSYFSPRYTNALSTPRAWHTASLLGSGKVLVVGGFNDTAGYLHQVELYDPSTEKWSTIQGLAEPRARHTATVLSSGQVLVAGGHNYVTNDNSLSSAVIYDPTTGLSCTTASKCASGYCVDGVCCESACMDTCKKCVPQISGAGSHGKCVHVAAGQSDKNATKACSGAGLCDG